MNKTYNHDNLILIGMPGSGKSTIGVLLAKALNREFIDSDLVIQKETGELLSDTIQRVGIDGFKEIEDRINSLLDVHNSIIATGGSAVFGPNAMKHFQEIGTILYLDVPYIALERRLGDLDERGVVELDLVLVDDEGLGVLDTEDLVEERRPENLALAFLVAFTLPMSGKVACGFLLLYRGHNDIYS